MKGIIKDTVKSQAIKKSLFQKDVSAFTSDVNTLGLGNFDHATFFLIYQKETELRSMQWIYAAQLKQRQNTK